MTDARIADAIARMREYGIVDSGDSLTLGIGAMTDARIAAFHARMAKSSVVPAGVDLTKVYTLRFVNRGVGLALRPRS
jgi:NitT/TauT family transport system substrate-binding protein